MSIEVGDAPRSSRAERPRGPVDPRLWKYSASARGYLVLTVVLAVIDVAMVVVAALTIGRVLAGIITTRTVAPAEWATELTILAGAVAIRALVAWSQTRFADRAADRVVAELRAEVLDVATELPGRELDPRRDEIATVLTRGIAGLRPYLTGYLPALVLVATLTPATWIVIAWQDLTSALIILVTLPIIPTFMILIGLLTKGKARRTLAAMTALSSQLLDLLAGLPTLRALGREKGPETRVRELGEEHRRTTMSALRVAFLSSMVLELFATLCVALVAVSIGLRLVYGGMPLEPGIVALILAPEVYLPLRKVGAQFHAAEDGMAAASRAFEVIDRRESRPARGDAPAPTERIRIELDRLSVAGRSGEAPHELSAAVEPGQITVLTGANGSGKSTALLTILGVADPDHGSVRVNGRPVQQIEPQRWWSNIGWLPQRPVLTPGTVRENIELSGPVEDIDAYCAATGFDEVLAELPDGWDTVIGVDGTGLSLGQRQRLALTRVLASGRPVLLLDEPTAHLDETTEATILRALRTLADEGRTVVVVGHRPSVLAAADRVVPVESREELLPEPPAFRQNGGALHG